MQFIRSLSTSYPHSVSVDERFMLARLAVFEALVRTKNAHEGDEAFMAKMRHVVQLMTGNEHLEGSPVFGIWLLTHPECPMHEDALSGGYTTQESYRHLCECGSYEAFFNILNLF